MILARIYASFGDVHGKLRKDKSTSVNPALQPTSFESITAGPLVGHIRKNSENFSKLICMIIFYKKNLVLHQL